MKQSLYYSIVAVLLSLLACNKPQEQLPARPMENWAFRSVLDSNARILTLALHKEMFLSYDAKNSGVYKAWKGKINFDGAVYNYVHGPQPSSQGPTYFQAPMGEQVWYYEKKDERIPLEANFKGYQFIEKGIQINFLLISPEKDSIWVSEQPEFAWDQKGENPVLSRKFKVKKGLASDKQIWLKTAKGIGKVNYTGTWEEIALENEGQEEFQTLWLALEVGKSLEFSCTFPYLASDQDGNQPKSTNSEKKESAKAEEIGDTERAPKINGLSIRVYTTQDPMEKIPRLVPQQTPNFSTIIPQLHLVDAIDFGQYTDPFITHVDGFIFCETAGEYTLRLSSDDGSRLFLDDELLIDNDGIHTAKAEEATLQLPAGETKVFIEHFKSAGDQLLKLEWRKPGKDNFEVIPQKNLRAPGGQVRVTSPGYKKIVREDQKAGDGKPLVDVHPSYDLISFRPEDFKPRVGGMDFLEDGRLVLCTWDSTGSVFVLENVLGDDPKNVKVKQIAQGLAEPLGLKVVNNEIYVLQKQELTRLIDHDGDGIMDEYEAVCSGWGVTSNFHEFAFGLVYKEGYFYANLAIAINPGGKSTPDQNPDRGRTIRIAPDGSYTFITQGLRTPNGIGLGPEDELFITDNQGDWVPVSKLMPIKEGAFYGSRAVNPEIHKIIPETPPAIWLPQGEIGNSPSQPILMQDEPYTGQMLHGEVTHGGIKRSFLEKVNGEYQGAVFRFTQGLEAGVNRLCWGPDGALYIGGVGSSGNWGQEGKLPYGLEKIKHNGKGTFEMLAIRARKGSMEIEFTEPLDEQIRISTQDLEIRQYTYLAAPTYGSPKEDVQVLDVSEARLSPDRKRLTLKLPGLKEGYVVYFRLDHSKFKSAQGIPLWSTEAWYTLNQIP